MKVSKISKKKKKEKRTRRIFSIRILHGMSRFDIIFSNYTMRLVFVIFVPINPLLFLSLSPKHTMNHSAAHEAAMADREFEVLNRIAVYRGTAKKIRPSENLN